MELLTTAVVVLWVLVVILVVVVFALARQVGVLYERVAPAGALMINQQLGRAELYHIRDDWAESADLAASRPEVVRQLTQQLARWEKTLPVKPPPTCMSRLRRDR